MTKAVTALVVLVDTREQTPPPFPDGVVLERATMPTGDYTTPLLKDVGVVERKSVSDFVSTLSWGRERFDREVQRMQAFRWRCVVVEGEITETYRVSAMHPHSILGSIASLVARWDVPVLFAGNPAGAGRLIVGILVRWQRRLADEGSSTGASGPLPVVESDPP